MSTTYDIITINYEKRKPSRATIMRSLGEHIKQGGKAFELHWGENCIELDYYPNDATWYGRGWIKEIGGHDIADELNAITKQARNQLLNLWNT